MPVSNHTYDDRITKPERGYSGRDGKGVGRTRELCERIGQAVGVSGLRKAKGVVMKWVLKLLGYREKTENIHEVIRDSCMLNVDSKERLERLRATLNGENGWFKGDANERGVE